MSCDYHTCKCGQLYVVYVPKKLELEEVKGVGPETTRVVEKIDERERKSGEIEAWKRLAKNEGAKFIDIRINRVLNCKCGETYDPLSFLSN